MDVAHPIRAVVPTLDGPVLEVMAGTTRPLTGLEIHRIAATGSPNGVRAVLARLVDQGLVQAEQRSTAIFYVANRDHLAWSAVEILVGMRRTLFDRLQNEFKTWRPAPIHASVFGSMARGDGGSESDVDLLLVRPGGTDEDESPWADQVDDIRRKVRAWTGNHCQAFQVDMERLAEYIRTGDPLVQEWLRDSIPLAGSRLKALIRQLPAAGER